MEVTWKVPLPMSSSERPNAPVRHVVPSHRSRIRGARAREGALTCVVVLVSVRVPRRSKTMLKMVDLVCKILSKTTILRYKHVQAIKSMVVGIPGFVWSVLEIG